MFSLFSYSIESLLKTSLALHEPRLQITAPLPSHPFFGGLLVQNIERKPTCFDPSVPRAGDFPARNLDVPSDEHITWKWMA